LLRNFQPNELEALTARIDPSRPTGFDYYPLLNKGERFPLADAERAPTLTPRSADDAMFLQGISSRFALETMPLPERGLLPQPQVHARGNARLYGYSNIVLLILRPLNLGGKAFPRPQQAPDAELLRREVCIHLVKRLSGSAIGAALMLADTGNEFVETASVALGGSFLTGGVGLVAGTLFGGTIFGLIAKLINFNGTLNCAWIIIVGDVLLFLFIVLQRFRVGSFRLRSAA
jgi:hypothetical protein